MLKSPQHMQRLLGGSNYRTMRDSSGHIVAVSGSFNGTHATASACRMKIKRSRLSLLTLNYLAFVCLIDCGNLNSLRKKKGITLFLKLFFFLFPFGM